VDGVTLVTDRDGAMRALGILERLRERPHAWDTETAGVLLGAGSQRQSPVNHGRVVCATCYCGDDADFGSGPRLFIDNSGPSEGLLDCFREYFEDPGFQKVFHNYSFERHVLRRHNIRLRGLHADTLHLARLFDTSLASWEGSVRDRADQRSPAPASPAAMAVGAVGAAGAAAAEPVSRAVLGVTLGRRPLERRLWEGVSGLHTSASAGGSAERRPPQRAPPRGYQLKSLAAHFGLASGEPQRPQGFAGLFGNHATAAQEALDSPERFAGFVGYATQDAVLTHRLFEHLRGNLRGLPWHSQVHQRPVFEVMKDPMVQKELLMTKSRPRTFESLQYATGKSMWSLFERYMRDFAECLADLEEVGVRVDRDALLLMEARATKDVEDHTREFADCMGSLRGPDGKTMNPEADMINVRSSAQLRLLLFGGAENKRNPEEKLEATRQFPIPKAARAEMLGAHRFEINSLELTPGLKRKDYSESGWPKTAASIVAQLAGDVPVGRDATPPKDGAAKSQLISRGYTQKEAERASHGLLELSRATRTKSILTGFIQPLLQHSEASGRIHPSWQFDTATGRLACRAPNLQNLPSAANDRYGIRDAFVPSPGSLFIVADYAQLELRVLAHVANCPFMIDQIKKGGDYHSDVAAQIFPHVRKAVEAGDVKVNDDGGVSGRTVKDVFKQERSQAKAVTFGIIYGMTASSLAEDLNVGADTAQGLIDAWLRYKPAVKKWMEHIRRDSRNSRRSLSMLGRPRTLPLIGEDSLPQHRYRSERAAVNFGIQGSAADIVVAAMLRLWRDPRLAEWGFRLVIQVHDEFVLEGPANRARDAAEVVREIMENPFREHSPDFKLKVPLAVAMTLRGSLGDGSCEELLDPGIAPCAEARRSPRQASSARRRGGEQPHGACS